MIEEISTLSKGIYIGQPPQNILIYLYDFLCQEETADYLEDFYFIQTMSQKILSACDLDEIKLKLLS